VKNPKNQKRIKNCTKCGREFPATIEYFHKLRGGLRATCKECSIDYSKRYGKEKRKINKQYWKNHTPFNSNKMKRCCGCDKEYPKTRKYWNKNICNKDGLINCCKRCNMIIRRINTSDITFNNRKMTLQDFYHHWKQCEGCCEICGTKLELFTSERVKIACIDHDHKTNKFRGIICRNCNLILGCASDNLLILFKACKFLLK